MPFFLAAQTLTYSLILLLLTRDIHIDSLIGTVIVCPVLLLHLCIASVGGCAWGWPASMHMRLRIALVTLRKRHHLKIPVVIYVDTHPSPMCCRARLCWQVTAPTDSAIAPPPKPAIFFNERSCFHGCSTQGRIQLKTKYPYDIFLCRPIDR